MTKLKAYDVEALGGWEGAAGASWPDRNPATVEELDVVYRERYQLSRTTLSGWMLRDIDRRSEILEVGASVGVQLECLRALGFTNLHACDVNADAIARCPFPGDVADVRALPYEDNSFDLVFTSGTLIHVPMDDKVQAVSEMARVTRRYLWGFEYQTYNLSVVTFEDLPPAYLLPLNRLFSRMLPGAALLRSETWRSHADYMTYAYLIDLTPLKTEGKK